MRPTDLRLKSKWVLKSISLTLLFLSLPTLQPATAEEPSAKDGAANLVVSGFHEHLIEVMQSAETLGFQGRFEKLQPIITQLFDTPTIARVILSRYWKEISDQQKSDFIVLFNHLSTATYASRFDSYSGESFTDLGSEELNKGRLLVKTELQRPDEDPVRMDYLLQKNADGWRIISVIADGVNDLSLKRAEYATIIREKGFDGLISDIRKKIQETETTSE